MTISAPGASRGGSDTIVTFRVPTESDRASTTGLKVQFPTDTPIASVLAQPMPGWTHTQKTVKLSTPIKTDDGEITEAVSEIDWAASTTANGIKPGEFGEFIVLAGQLPDAAEVTFKVIQQYSDGTTADWIEVPAAGSTAEPEHPAPVLQLAAAASDDAPTVRATAPATATAKSSSQTGAVVLAVIALVAALVAVGLGVVAVRGSRAGSRGGAA